ncbi:MAG: CvpA family protein [Clostridiales Family XIII bacterium]|jgi:uncharacterized membrane protein required for colicin V production|nr:CvpA family protein [Clostridiales Family XIII bacterium]
MFFDILIIAIIAVCAVFGFRAGFLISLTRLVGWVGAVIIAFFFHKDVEAWAIEHTTWYDKLAERIDTICNNFVSLYASSVTGNLPKGLADSADSLANTVASEAAAKIAGHAFTILIFVGIIFGIKIILLVATLLLSKKFHSGFLGFIDGFVGLLLGLFSSIIAILVAFAFIMPLSYSISTNAYFFVQQQMENSVIAQIIYDNNPLLDVMDAFIPAELNPERWVEQTVDIASQAGDKLKEASDA